MGSGPQGVGVLCSHAGGDGGPNEPSETVCGGRDARRGGSRGGRGSPEGSATRSAGATTLNRDVVGIRVPRKGGSSPGSERARGVRPE